ncbi:superfamily II DNA/RNA helicase [Balneicella halophila]|uniref:Superfamily II DNA/RNA helicase n=1 Tax=Balneicella halophila TaxID=1537566 RepID=A0A7L4UQE6_BALHA|nr:DEAD/DEAH box helicase [Balneicella halophila]PVX51036.1 superfamily II DNA/RNA helicase [Balneicella halophila]
MKFTDLPFNDVLQDALSCMGFETATPVQEEAIPLIIDGHDIIASAQTGTGKTAAFILPVLHKLTQEKSKGGVNTLVLCPTRELAIQIEQEIQAFAYFAGISSIAIYGGDSGNNWEQEKKSLTVGADIVVATPGRLIAHLNMGYVEFSNVKHLILDEADRMLDIGFFDDIIGIIKQLPDERQSMLFSATMPPKIEQLSKKILKNPKRIKIAVSKVAEGVLQAAYLVHNNQKVALVRELLKDKQDEYESVIIFCATKQQVSEVVRELRQMKMSVQGISSNLEQREREEVLLKFKAKNIRILVATDVISRGIDIKDIQLIVNFNVPADAEDYVHRVGRTARAKTTGVALTFINPDDMYRFQKIEKLIDKEIIKLQPPGEIGDGPEWNPNAKPEKKRWKKKK